MRKIKLKYFDRPVINYFNTSFNKKVFISYITSPFKGNVDKSHSNKLEALKIAEIFNAFGYQVDIFNYLNVEQKINLDDYDVFFGIGPLYEKIIKNKLKNKKYIFYATGAYFCFANNAELNRLKKLYERKGVLLNPKRFIKNPTYYALKFSDAIIMTGNDWTKSTFIYSQEIPKYKVPVSVYEVKWKVDFNKDYSKAKKNFLWFGSSGLVHKGLDLCIEVFKDLPDYNLFICGPREDDFFRVYEKELNLPNIHYMGFMDIDSYKFKQIVEKCAFSIFSSCSEGQSGAVLTTMSIGLIPIVTEMVGVDIQNKGFFVTDDIEEIKRKVIKVSKLPNANLQELSKKNIEFINQNHRIKHFEKKMKENLLNILGETNG
ncbi:glycosyl transferase, group 1 family protein [Nautilia profundicola AmH]|uniref:Glycosyl transferase, group 1 family protein n=1 Tax=Nautilia profundicola (strain ATCC BAA-1463 / DSM 18972 / AmH) TaxID=598659 RepID=B9L6Q7_NAUPA|nr:glycosyltransferase [Nautilia profundicola]ACM92081.1 glycosyl transferase, group 1 family protein [Nautilia profundicola AmH]